MAWMKQKPETGTGPQTQTPPQAKSVESARSSAPVTPRESKMESLVNIGQSVEIKGELTGNEDLTIEGMVDGKIQVKGHSLTIGANGRIKAEVHAKMVVVLGQVQGNITADDKVEIAPSGQVDGDIRAPRVAIADGAKFRGSIDMNRGNAQAKDKSSGMSVPATKEMPRSALRRQPGYGRRKTYPTYRSCRSSTAARTAILWCRNRPRSRPPRTW